MTSTVKYGLMAGLLMAGIQVILHYVSFEMSQNLGLATAIGLIIPIVFMVMGVIAERNNQEGFISFGEALKTAFFVYMIAAILSTIISFGHMKTFNDETWGQIAELQKSNAQGLMEMVGADAVEVEEAFDEQFSIEKIKEQTSGVSALLLGVLGAAIFGLILSLIIAAIMKRNPTP